MERENEIINFRWSFCFEEAEDQTDKPSMEKILETELHAEDGDRIEKLIKICRHRSLRSKWPDITSVKISFTAYHNDKREEISWERFRH